MSAELNRRSFIKAAVASSMALAASVGLKAGAEEVTPPPAAPTPTPGPAPVGDPGMMGFKVAPMEKVRVAFVGVGGRGTGHVNDLLHIDGVEVKAICDIDESHAKRSQDLVTKAGQPSPELYTKGDTDYKRLCQRDDVDIIYNATPWNWHCPIAVEAMKNGKHIAVEVPTVETLEECWELVETAEKTKRHCMLLENCCYGDSELFVLNMVRQGVFGELNHGEAAYIHDLRRPLFSGQGEGKWRLKPTTEKNGNIYPTHGLGPVAQYMNINRGDRFDYLVSMSSPARGMHAYALDKFGADDPRSKLNFVHGDMNTSLIKTVNGQTIMLQHDTTSPRPYSRINMISGVKGMFYGYPDRLTFGHEFLKPEEYTTYQKKYEHPLWKKVGEMAKKMGGHGGMDYIMNYRLMDCLRRGLPLDIDVYDSVSWSVVTELSIKSLANKSAPQDFPDFTRGRWKTGTPLGIVE